MVLECKYSDLWSDLFLRYLSTKHSVYHVFWRWIVSRALYSALSMYFLIELRFFQHHNNTFKMINLNKWKFEIRMISSQRWCDGMFSAYLAIQKSVSYLNNHFRHVTWNWISKNAFSYCVSSSMLSVVEPAALWTHSFITFINSRWSVKNWIPS